MEIKDAGVFYNLTIDGKCPVCDKQIKTITSTYEILKIRFLKMFYADGIRFTKCPDCKTLIEIGI